MEDRGLCDFTSFSGYLEAPNFKIPIDFSARIDHRGEVEFVFGFIPLTQETSFIMTYWDDDRSTVNCFSLTGKSENGIEFKTEDLYFNSLNHESSREHGSRMNPVGCCFRADFHQKLTESISKPTFRIRLKGFRNFGNLRKNCMLGTIIMGGKTSIEDPDTITGYICVEANEEIRDLFVWHQEVDKLLEHIRRIMSFASTTILQAPITEFFAGSAVEVIALSQSKQVPTSMQTFHYLDQQPIFDAAVSSFFAPPIDIKNLFFAIEWFAMDTTYNEVHLVSAMTALENLIASNLGESDAMIRPVKEFNKIRTMLRQVIKKCVDKWSAEETEKAKEVVAELNERLADLNRRSIIQKLKVLSERWSVPLDGIGDDRIRAAKRARDLIVHQGHYYGGEYEKSNDLWEHVTTIREVVIRFLLTAIGYKGRYLSYLGGYHDAHFPPLTEASNILGNQADNITPKS